MKKFPLRTVILLALTWVAGCFGLVFNLHAQTIVTNAADNGPGTLRSAIANATNDEVITFAPNLSGGTILLASTLTISTSLTIDASALPGGIQINGNASVTVFNVASGTTNLLNSLTITNGSGGGGGGGGILNNGTLTVNQCAVSGNFAADGGGIFNYGTLMVNQCTLSGNSAEGGGGIENFGTLTINQSTLSENFADSESGGGIDSDGTLTITNTIVAGNVGGGDLNNYASLTFGGSNLVQFLNGSYTGPAPITNAAPLLAPLGNYGGPTQTMPPLPGSPAIAAGSVAANTFATDQRGYPRTQNGLIDIGAVEFAPVSPVVTNLADAGPGSLRQAIVFSTNGTTITFATNLSGGTITLGSTLQINTNLTIDASALPGGIQINGNASVQVFNVTTNNTVVFNSLTITNGYSLMQDEYGNYDGGGVYNDGTLMLNQCTLSGNYTANDDVDSGQGGAIYNLGTLMLNQSTLSGNVSANVGGGIFNEGTASVNQSTLSGNYGEGGGIFNEGTLTITNTIVAGNSGDIFNHIDGGLTFGGSNLVQFLNGSYTGPTPITNAPDLAPLDNYGGPTQTMPPLPGSPAIGAGSVAANTFATDQRGYPRTQNMLIDIGAVELPTIRPFTASPTNAPVGAPVQFNGADVDSDGSAVTQWNWSFGDGATSTNQSPSHIYASAGSFSPALIVTNSLGLTLAAPGPTITAIIDNALVVNTNDSGIGSLRQAIADATNGTTITFYTNLSGATIMLASTLAISTNLTIDASALAGGIQINGGEFTQVFNVTSNIIVVLDSLTIANGEGGNGGGIYSDGTLTVNQCTLAYNSAQDGGGIYNDGTLTVNQCFLTNNNTIAASYDMTEGGGIYNNGTATVSQSTLSENTARPYENYGYASGGGIYNNGTMSVNECTLSGNQCAYSVFTEGSYGGYAYGGGIYNGGMVSINECTLWGNRCSAENIFNNPDGVTVAEGGGIYSAGALWVNECTLWDNYAVSSEDDGNNGGGIYSIIYPTLAITNSIVAENVGGDIFNSSSNIAYGGANIIQEVFNEGNNTGPIPINADPQLAPLGNYGGPTQTLPPLPGSPAIDAGSVSANTFATDQRGYPRLLNGQMDIGAVEGVYDVTVGYNYTASPTNGTVPLTVQFNCTNVDSGGNPVIQWTWNFGDGTTSTNQNPSHVYASVGSFAPILLAANNLGTIFPGSGPSIAVSPPPVILVDNGEQFQSAGATLGGNGASNNTAVVSGAGSVWTSTSDVVVGQSGSGNQLLVANGGAMVVTGNLTVGSAGSSNNLVQISNGTLIVTNSSGTGTLTINNGSLLFSGGTLIVNELIITNSSGSFTFSGGVLEVSSAVVSNGLAFTIGDGTDSATITLEGGTNLFENGFTVSDNAMINGNGTVVSPAGITVYGTVSPGDAPGQLVMEGNVILQGTASMKIDKTTDTNDLVTVAGQLNYGGTLQIRLLNGTTLAAGDSFRLFSASNYAGAFAAIIPPTPGAGLVWNTQTLYTNGVLTVVASSPLVLTGISLSGTNLVLNGANGISGQTYYVLASTNLALPLSQWTLVATNIWSGNGNFSFIVTNGISGRQKFYRLVIPAIDLTIFQDTFDPTTGAGIGISYDGGDLANPTVGVVSGVGVAGLPALQIQCSVTNGPNGYAYLAGQWQDQTVSGNTDANLSDYYLSFDAYVTGDASHQSGGGFALQIQEGGGANFSTTFPQGQLQTYQAYQGGSDLLVPQSGVWKHFTVNLGGSQFQSPNGTNINFNVTGGTWQLIFQLNSLDWGGEPQTNSTLIIDNIALTVLPPL